MDNREILLDLIVCVTGDEKGEFLPLDDSYENLQSFYREEVNKKLRELGKTIDLSGYTFEPNSTFFICDGLVDSLDASANIHPFSKKDIDILLETKVNPYTDRKFSENGLENLKKIKEYFKGKFTHWGGLLELLETLDENTILGREDIDILRNKIIAIENSKTKKELCKIVESFGSEKDGELAYLNSPVLDGLHMWCKEKDTNNYIALTMLIERGLQIDFFDAVKQGKIHIVKLLLENDLHDEDDINYAFYVAAENGYLEIVKLLLENGADVHSYCTEGLYIASKKGYTEVVKLILQNGTFGVGDLSNALQGASSKGRIDIVKLLLEYGADIQYHGIHLENAAANGHVEVVRFLLENGAQIDDTNDWAFRIAVKRGYNEIVELLRAAINRRNRQ